MFSISVDTASGCPVLRESSSLFGRLKSFCPNFPAARLSFSCRYTWELSTSKFEPELPQFPVARPALFLLLSVCLGWILSLVFRRTSISMSHRSRVSNPSLRSPASREVTSDSVELCETEVCFLHILTGTDWDTTWGWFWLLKGARKFCESWNYVIQVCSAVLYFLHDKSIDDSHSCDEYMMKSALLIGCDMLESIFKTDLTSFFTDHQISGRPIRAKYKHFETMCGQTSDNSPTDSSSSCLKWLSSKQGCETLQSCFPFFCLPIRSIVQRIFLSMSFHVEGPQYCLCVRFLPSG